MLADLDLGIFAIPLALISLICSVQIFRKKLVWGQVRYLGLTMASFGLMVIIYYLVLFGGVYGFVVSILDHFILGPSLVLIDVLRLIVILGLSMAVYFSSIDRDKFKSGKFITVFLIPVSIPGGRIAVYCLKYFGILSY